MGSCNKLNGYVTVEASFIVPMVIGIFYLIIICSFWLFLRCYRSERAYIENLRIERYTNYYGNIPMVIYGDSDTFNPIEKEN